MTCPCCGQPYDGDTLELTYWASCGCSFKDQLLALAALAAPDRFHYTRGPWAETEEERLERVLGLEPKEET